MCVDVHVGMSVEHLLVHWCAEQHGNLATSKLEMFTRYHVVPIINITG